MAKLILKYLLTLAFLFFLFQISAQDAGLEKSLRAQFSEPEKVQWIKTFKGRLNDFNDILIVLAFDGYNCKGRLSYLRSKTTFNLEGTIQDNNLQIKEIDGAGNVSGHLRGKLIGNILEGSWSNFDNTITGEIILLESRKPNDFPTHCGDNKWYGFYKGKTGNLNAELILQKGASNQISGVFYFKNQSYRVKGEIDSKNEIALAVEKFEGEKSGNLSGDFKNQKNFKAAFAQKNEADILINFKLEEKLSSACFEYADYSSSYDLIYPKTRNSAFNDYIRKETELWISACRTYSKSLKNNQLNSDNRSFARAYGWCDLEHYSDRLISGLITYKTTWGNENGFVFNFDLNGGALLKEEDLFKDHFNRSHYLKSFVKKAFVNHPLYGNDDFKDWILNVQFPNFIIRKDGINFSTEFDLIYGRQNMTIPWSELKPYLREVKFTELGILN